MATIALYANKINQMPGMINEAKRAVTDYKSELLALKMKTLTINKSVCNLEDVIRSIQASTQTQDEKVNSLELFYQNSERFITEVVSTDEKAADIIRQRKNDFYEEYSYLKPECEKEWLEQAGDWFVSVGEWCKEHWKAAITIIIVAASVIVIVAVPAAAPILIAAAKGAIFGAVTGGLMGGLTSLAFGGSFLEGLENGAFMGAISGIIAGGMTFGFTKGVEGVTLTLGQCIAVGTGGGAGSQFLSDIGDIFIKKEKISFGEVIFNTAIAGGIGGIFGAVGYGASKGWSALKLKTGGGESGKTADDIYDLYRKASNTGEFKDLDELMQLKNVKSVANDAGIGLDGIKIKIDRNPELLGKGVYGFTDGKTITLYPDAFTDIETLAKTLGHERMHVYQVSVFGKATSTEILTEFEKAAYSSEKSWWDYYNFMNGGK